MQQITMKLVLWLLTDEESLWQFLTAENMALAPCVHYPLDVSPCDLCLFPKMKLQL